MKGISMPVEGREIFYLLLKHLKGSVNSTWQSGEDRNLHAASTAAELQLKHRHKTEEPQCLPLVGLSALCDMYMWDPPNVANVINYPF